MSLSPTIVQLPFNWSVSRAGQPIVAVIAHNTVGTDSRNYLTRGGELADGSDRKVSIHALIQKDGTIYRYVPDERGANHAGFGTMPAGFPQVNPNLCTLGFELENTSDGISRVDPYPTPQLLAMGWQIVTWQRRWGALPIFRHADIDPGRRRDTAGLSVVEITRWVARAKALMYDTKRYLVTHATPVYTSREHPDTVALDGQAQLMPGEPLLADDVTSGWAHRSDGLGFVPLGALKEQL